MAILVSRVIKWDKARSISAGVGKGPGGAKSSARRSAYRLSNLSHAKAGGAGVPWRRPAPVPAPAAAAAAAVAVWIRIAWGTWSDPVKSAGPSYIATGAPAVAEAQVWSMII